MTLPSPFLETMGIDALCQGTFSVEFQNCAVTQNDTVWEPTAASLVALGALFSLYPTTSKHAQLQGSHMKQINSNIAALS